MKPKKTMKELVRWRLEQARKEAPPAPRASQLLNSRDRGGRSPNKTIRLVPDGE